MKFICDKDNLDIAISTVQKAVKTNSTVPILEGILIQAQNNSVKLTGYDLNTGIEADVKADVLETGIVVINSSIFGNIIKKLPGNMVSISVDENHSVHIESEESHYDISGLEADSFPKIPVLDTTNKIILPQAALKKMITKTIFAASKDESRPTLTGCYIESNGNELTMVATDGFRMAIRREKIEKEFPEMKFIIPGKTLSELAKIFDDDDDEVIIYATDNNLLFDIGSVRVVSRLIPGPFVAYQSIIKSNPVTSVTVNRNVLQNSVERASIVISNEERRCPVVFSMENGNDSTLVISAQSTIGSSKEKVEIEIEGDKLDIIRLNSRYVIEALKNIDDENIKIKFNGSLGPCSFVPCDGEDFLYLVLPVRK